MAICNQCNQEINQDANFCPYCGAVRDSVVTELHGTVIDSSLNLAKPFVPGHKRAQLVKAFLVITILLNVVLIVPAYAETRPNYLPGSHPLDFLWLFWFFNFLITAILFLMWIYRSNKNLTALGAGETDFSPRSSVLWWFVPIMNIYKPKKLLKKSGNGAWEWTLPFFRGRGGYLS